MEQKELKAIYHKEIEKAWESPRMVDYCAKKAAYIVELSDGQIMEIDKPDIKKDFCFGHGYCGISTDEEEERAHGMAALARTSENYFLEKNLEPIDHMIEKLQDHRYIPYKGLEYSEVPGSVLYFVTFYNHFDEPRPGHVRLTEEETAAIIDGYREVRKQFVKRLNSYLKRYGLTKLNVWTYLSD